MRNTILIPQRGGKWTTPPKKLSIEPASHHFATNAIEVGVAFNGIVVDDVVEYSVGGRFIRRYVKKPDGTYRMNGMHKNARLIRRESGDVQPYWKRQYGRIEVGQPFPPPDGWVDC